MKWYDYYDVPIFTMFFHTFFIVLSGGIWGIVLLLTNAKVKSQTKLNEMQDKSNKASERAGLRVSAEHCFSENAVEQYRKRNCFGLVFGVTATMIMVIVCVIVSLVLI